MTSVDGVNVGASAPDLVSEQSHVLMLAVEDQKALQVTTAVTIVAFTTQTVVPTRRHYHHHASPLLLQRQDGPCWYPLSLSRR